MARRFKRRGRRGLWLPVLGNAAQGNATDWIVGIKGYAPVLANGDIVAVADEVTFDYTTNPFTVQSSAWDYNIPPTLHDITAGGEWRLRRIVGKHHAGYVSPLFTNAEKQIPPPAVEYACGYIVLKTDEEGTPLTDLDQVNPLVMESAEDPWIWRRKWILGNAEAKHDGALINRPATTDQLQWEMWALGQEYPVNTALFGSVADGPHIDQKTNRVIHRQERLFHMVATRIWAPVPWTPYTFPEPGLVFYHTDHRFFGALSMSRGNRRNASR